MSPQTQQRTPVILITGFLGSGKTTLINHILRTSPMMKISLILNEFGENKLESQFVEASDATNQVVELKNGCMCCVASSDIPRAVKQILDQASHTELILIEASGLSDPDPIYAAIEGRELSPLVELQKIICVVDTETFEKNRSEHTILLSQVGDAHLIFLNKTQLAGPKKTARVRTLIESIGVETQVLIWDDSLDIASIVAENTPAKRSSNDTAEHNHHHHHQSYDEFWFRSEKEINLESFSAILNALPENIVRAKGYLHASDAKVLVQYVGGHSLETKKMPWYSQKPTTEVLFLGKHINSHQLKKQLMSCEQNN